MDEEKAILLLSQMGINKLNSFFYHAKERDIDNILETLCNMFGNDREKLANEIKSTLEQMLEDDRGLQEPEAQEIVSEKFQESKKQQLVKNSLAREGRLIQKTLNFRCRQKLAKNEKELSRLNEEIEIRQNEKERMELKLKKPSITSKEREELQKKIEALEKEIRPLMDSRESCLTNIGEAKALEKETKSKEIELLKKMINFEDYYKGLSPEEFEEIRVANRFSIANIENIEKEGLAKFANRTPAEAPSESQEEQQTVEVPTEEKLHSENGENLEEVAQANEEQTRIEETRAEDSTQKKGEAISFGGVPVTYTDFDLETPQDGVEETKPEEQLEEPILEGQTKVGQVVAEQEEAILQEQGPAQESIGIDIPEEYLPKEPQRYITTNNDRVLNAILSEAKDANLFTEEQMFGIMKSVHDQCGTKADDRVILQIILEEKAKSNKLSKTRMAIAEKTRDYIDLVNGNIKPDETRLKVKYDFTGAKEALPKGVWEELKELAYQSRHFAEIIGVPKSVELEWNLRDKLGKTNNRIGIYIPELEETERNIPIENDANEQEKADSNRPSEQQNHEDFAQSLIPENLESPVELEQPIEQEELPKEPEVQTVDNFLQNSLNPDGTYKSDEQER